MRGCRSHPFDAVSAWTLSPPSRTGRAACSAVTSSTPVGGRSSRYVTELDVGRWQQLATTVVALQTGPLTPRQRLWLGVLHAGQGAVLSHLTACLEAGLRWTAATSVDVLTSKGDLVAPLPGFTFHQTRRPYAYWVDPDARRPGCGWSTRRCSPPSGIGRSATGHRACRRRRATGLSTPDRLMTAASQIRKLRHGAHPQARARRHRRWRPVVRRDRHRPAVRRRRAASARPSGATPRPRRPAALPRLRVAARRREGRRAGDRRVVPHAHRALVA